MRRRMRFDLLPSFTYTPATTGFCLAALVALLSGCNARSAVLIEQAEARRLVADLQAHFARTGEASNRAVMADTDEAAAAAAKEAEQSATAVQSVIERIHPLLQSLDYEDEQRAFEAFKLKFAEYRTIEGEILPLAQENSNFKAQTMAGGPAQQAVTQFRAALESAMKLAPSKTNCCLDAMRALADLLEIQVIETRHIAESDDDAMTRMEAEMARLETEARTALIALRTQLPEATSQLADATAALDRFEDHHDQIVKLSRRNSDVRSLALSLGRMRTVTAAGVDDLRALDEALAKHEFNATR